MKKFTFYCWFMVLLIILFAFNFAASSYAATTSGTLTTDETWSGTINITGDVTVPMGLTLTIEPGTEVVFTALSDDTAGGSDSSVSELIINGSLIAIGTEANKIMFTSGAFFKVKGDWGGIRASWGSGLKTLQLEHCIIEYASLGINWQAMVGMQSATISSCTIRHTLGNGVYVYGESGSKVSVDMQGSEITDNNGRGIYCYVKDSSTGLSGNISSNTITNNGSNGLYVYTYTNAKSNLLIESNIIHDNNEYGIYLYTRDTFAIQSQFEVKNNTVYACGTGIYCYAYNSDMAVDVTGNEVYQSSEGIYLNIYVTQKYTTSSLHANITGNNIHENSSRGIYCYARGYSSYSRYARIYTEITGNGVYQNASDGIQLVTGVCGQIEPVITLNTVYGNNGRGIYCQATTTTKIVYNNIYNNTGYELYNNSSYSIDARYNFWDVYTRLEMTAGGGFTNISSIYDIFDDNSKGMVNYLQWSDTELDISANLISKITDPASGDIRGEGPLNIHGIAYATDGIEKVEVSWDNGATWEEALTDNKYFGKTLWSFTINEIYDGDYTIISRVIDKNGFVESPGHQITLTINRDEITVAGSLVSNETWSGVVDLEGDVIVPEGITLTILPGTTVTFPALFDATFSGNNTSKTEFIVNGALLAEGIVENPIVFMSNRMENSQKGDWVGIRIYGYARLQYTTVEYSDYGIYFYGDEDQDELFIKDCTIQHTSGNGIYAYVHNNANIPVTIENNDITDNNGKGIYCRAYTFNSMLNAGICGNTVYENGDTGIYCYADGGSGDPKIIAIICNNTVYGHTAYGIYCYTLSGASSELSIENNTVYNSGDGIYTYYNSSSALSTLAITSNTLHTGTQGIEVYARYSSISPSIQNNTIHSHTSNGINCTYYGSSTLLPSLEGNQVLNNAGNGIYLNATGEVTIINNSLYDNISYDIYNDSGHDIIARSNWWGVSTTNKMNSGTYPEDIDKIYDSFDNSSKGMVDYGDWLNIYDVPGTPTLTPVTTPTNSVTQVLSGTKDAGTSIILNNAQVVPVNDETNWSYERTLTEGKNSISIYSKNAAGMASGIIVTEIVRDTTAPSIYSSVPEDGDFLSRIVESIDITLMEKSTEIDTTATLDGAIVVDQDGLEVLGQWAINYNHIVFTPNYSFGVGTYILTFYPTDMPLGNTRTSTITFTVDLSAPAAPTLNEIVSPTTTASQTISGGKEAGTAIYLNDTQIVSFDDQTYWSYELGLSEGENSYLLFARDQAGNQSDELTFAIILDRAPPILESSEPSNGSFINVSPTRVTLFFADATTALAEGPTLATGSIYNSHNVEIPGTWELQTPNTVVFIPSYTLIEERYTVSIQAQDLAGNTTSSTITFTYDGTPPTAPTLEPVASPTNFVIQTLSGTKEPNTSIWLNGIEIIPINENVNWSYLITLVEGENPLEIYSKDRAVNQSQSVFATIIYDETAPLPVTNLTADGKGIGTTVTLDWTGYNEQIQGDIESYRVYVEDHLFTQLDGLEPVITLPASTFNYTVSGLLKGTLYYFAVVAVDTMNNALTSVTPVSDIPIDIAAPEDVTNLRVQCFDTRLIFSWDHSANTHGDLEGYKVYFNGAAEVILLPVNQSTYEATDLTAATAYAFTIKAYDPDGNESNGLSITGVTLLLNPANVSTTPYNGYVDISWDAVEPSQYVKHYSIYVSNTDFTSVERITPKVSVTGTSGKVAGLVNNETYYFAVTTVNISDGERKDVSTVS